MIFLCYKIFRVLFYPILRWPLVLLNQRAKAQMKFEFEKSHKLTSETKRKVIQADYHFEVSSEGELEQIYYPLIELLNAHKNIILFYCSQSVRHKVEILEKEFIDNLTIIPVSILNYFPLNNPYKNNGATLVMCRYDFFPELVFEKTYKKKILLSASLRNFQNKNWFSKLYLKGCYQQFSKIVAATQSDKEKFKTYLGLKEEKLEAFDFRSMSIFKRLSASEVTLNAKFPFFLNQFYPLFKKQKMIIFGSFWNHEVLAFKNSDHDILQQIPHVLVPHQLSTKSLAGIQNELNSFGIKVLEINQNTTENEFQQMFKEYKNSSCIWIFNIKGVLCEMYSFFDLAYIGGGFGKSVHSVLEPFLAGNKVYLGPINHRSSELLAIQNIDSQKVEIIEHLEDLLPRIYGGLGDKGEKNIDLENKFRLKCKETMEWLEF